MVGLDVTKHGGFFSDAPLACNGQSGAQIELVHEPDDQGRYLKTCIQQVQCLPNSYWINRYANQLNWKAHWSATAVETLQGLDVLSGCLLSQRMR
jgi:cysteine synthase A